MIPIFNILAKKKRTVTLVSISLLILTILVILSIEKKENNDLFTDNYFPYIRVMIQNGCGFTGVANNVRNSVSDMNIDVVEVGNARQFIYNETLIVVKHNDEQDLKRLQNMTGIKNVIYAINENYFVPFIIIAGRDYQTYFPQK